MILFVPAGLAGALVGLYSTRRLTAIPAVVLAIALLQAAVIVAGWFIDPQGSFALVQRAIVLVAGEGPSALLPTITAAGTGALCAAVLWSAVRGVSTNEFWFSSETGLKPAAADWPSHIEAKARIDAQLSGEVAS